MDQIVRTYQIDCKDLNDKLDAKLTATQGSAVTGVTGTAGGIYTITEQTMINDTKTQLNALLTTLRAAGVIAP